MRQTTFILLMSPNRAIPVLRNVQSIQKATSVALLQMREGITADLAKPKAAEETAVEAFQRRIELPQRRKRGRLPRQLRMRRFKL